MQKAKPISPSFVISLLSLAGIFLLLQPVDALPKNFRETTYVRGLNTPTAMAWAPDGRLFVAEQGGSLRVVKKGKLLSKPFLTLSVTANSERGLLGIAFDPDFARNRYLYLYYTRSQSPIKNRVSRFRADDQTPDVVAAGSEKILLDNIASDAGNHNGGAIHFGRDRKLYIGVGDGGANRDNSASLRTLSGKLLRINRDGSVPADNPFLDRSGARDEIWAFGLRNPFTFAVDPKTGKMFINDVGQNTWEEVNRGKKGANYGWPVCEGRCGVKGVTNPIAQYATGSAGAVTGGAFYRSTKFPARFHGNYFFGDYLQGFIKRLDASNRVQSFHAKAKSPVDITVGPDGNLYYLSIVTGNVYRISPP